ncbi:FHA domain-containing protein [Arcanobacterium canis]
MRGYWYQGEALAAVSPTGALLIQTQDDISEFYRALAMGVSFDQILELIRRSWNTVAMPEFCLVVHQGDEVRVAIRGKIPVRYAGEEICPVHHLDLWKESRHPIGEFRLGVHAGTGYPFRSGVVRAQGIDIDFTLRPSPRTGDDCLASTLDHEAIGDLYREMDAQSLQEVASQRPHVALPEPPLSVRSVASAQTSRMHKIHGGQVLAARCLLGHPNSPTSVSCRICGANVGEATQWIDPPVLGYLLTNTGAKIGIERDVVIGRDPARKDGQCPKLLKVPSPNKQVSRTHAAVIVAGWTLRVIDLESGNGTYLLRQGAEPLRISTTTATRLFDGDVLDLGDGVRIEVMEQ